MKQFFLKLIRLYQKYLSPDTGWAKSLLLTDKVCRFTPTCSEYTHQAIKKYGTIKGCSIGIGRILKCHPWSKGGQDPLK